MDKDSASPKDKTQSGNVIVPMAMYPSHAPPPTPLYGGYARGFVHGLPPPPPLTTYSGYPMYPNFASPLDMRLKATAALPEYHPGARVRDGPVGVVVSEGPTAL